MQQDCEIITKRGKGCGMIENFKVTLLRGMECHFTYDNWYDLMSFNDVKCEIVSKVKVGGPMAPSNVVYQQCKYVNGFCTLELSVYIQLKSILITSMKALRLNYIYHVVI